MRLSVRLLGLDLLDIEVSTDEGERDPACDLSGGTLASYPVGFTPSAGDQRWEGGVELG